MHLSPLQRWCAKNYMSFFVDIFLTDSTIRSVTFFLFGKMILVAKSTHENWVKNPSNCTLPILFNISYIKNILKVLIITLGNGLYTSRKVIKIPLMLALSQRFIKFVIKLNI